MNRIISFVVLGSTALAWSGCASIDQSLQARIAREAVALSPAVDDDAEVAAAGAHRARGGFEERDEFALPDSAALGEYVAAALQRNRSIRRAVRWVQAQGFRVPQVTSLEDPMIGVVPPTGNMVETAAGMMDGGIDISQTVPLPGRLSRRGRIAEQEVLMALAELTDVRVRVTTDVARSYFDYYLTAASLDVARASEQLLGDVRDVAAARYRAGAGGQQDLLRAEVELFSVANEVIDLEQRRVTARARLNALMDRPIDAPLPQPPPFDLQEVAWRLSQAMEQAVVSNPQLALLREQITRDLERIRLARLEYYPDLRVSFSYNFIGSGISPVATGRDNWSLPLGMNLPIWWGKIRAGILEANATTLASIEQIEEARNALLVGLQDTLIDVDIQYRQAVLVRDQLLPRSRHAIDAATAAYRAGDVEFSTLIESWRNWLDYSLAYHRALAAMEQRFADLQQLIGSAVARQAASARADSTHGELPLASAGEEVMR